MTQPDSASSHPHLRDEASTDALPFAPALGATQRWRLVDYDAALLKAARAALLAWADDGSEAGPSIAS